MSYFQDMVALLTSRERGGPYLGQVAGQCRLPSTLSAASTQLLSRSRHILRAATPTIRIALPTGYAADNVNGVESGIGVTASIRAYIVVGGNNSANAIVGGTLIGPVTWSGEAVIDQASGLMANLSDPINLGSTRAAGTVIWVQAGWECSAGILYETGATGSESLDSTNGEQMRFAASGLDLTQVSAMTAWSGGTSSVNLRYSPSLIVAPTQAPSVMIWGSSIADGFGASAKGTPGAPASSGEIGDKGLISRVLGATLAYSQVAGGGSQVAQLVNPANRVMRMQMAPYFSHIAIDGPTNDLGGGAQSAAQCIGHLQDFAALFPWQPVFTTTVTPRTTGGTWLAADGSDQTLSELNSFSTKLPGLNTLMRAGIAGIAGVWDVNAAVRLGSDDTKWHADGVNNQLMTADGVHFKSFAEQRVRSEGAINPADIVR